MRYICNLILIFKGDVPDFLMLVIGDRFQLDMIRLVGMSLQKYFLVPYTLFKRKKWKNQSFKAPKLLWFVTFNHLKHRKNSPITNKKALLQW